jgi:iron complex transport system ATP-binding protein
LAVTHDLNLAAAYSDRVVVLQAGELVRDATPPEVFNPATLRDVFGVTAEVQHTSSGKPWISYGD